MDRPNYITPAGYTVLREEYELLLGSERPKLVEVISWAAGNGDRSENGAISMGASGCARSTGGSAGCRGG